MSIVSVSRRASPPHFGHRVSTNARDFSRGLPSAPRNSTSSGSRTGRSESGTGTTPQVGQWIAGIGVPQYRCREISQSRSRYTIFPLPIPFCSIQSTARRIASGPHGTPFQSPEL